MSRRSLLDNPRLKRVSDKFMVVSCSVWRAAAGMRVLQMVAWVYPINRDSRQTCTATAEMWTERGELQMWTERGREESVYALRSGGIRDVALFSQ